MKCSKGFQGRWVISYLQPEARALVNFEYSYSFILIIYQELYKLMQSESSKLFLFHQFQLSSIYQSIFQTQKIYSKLVLPMFKPRSHNQQTTVQSLVKSKQMLAKINNKITSTNKNSNSKLHHNMLKKFSIKDLVQETIEDINTQLQTKIELNFTKLLNKQTVMPVGLNLYQPVDKQNFASNQISSIEGTKILMHEYWQKQNKEKQKYVQTPKKLANFPKNNKQRPSKKQKQKLPIIDTKAIILGKLQKKKQQDLKDKNEDLKAEFYSYLVEIKDFKIQNESTQFLTFQRINFKKWQEISFVLKSIEKFTYNYKIHFAEIKLKKILDLLQIQNFKKQRFNIQKATFTPHELLGCLEDAEKISQKNYKSKGIRFYGNKGKKRAVIKIQTHVRRWIQQKKFRNLVMMVDKIIKIQKNFRCYLQYKQTKNQICQNQMQKISKFNEIQNGFRQNYRRFQITKKIKYQIHICSLSVSQWQRITTKQLNQVQNTQISRIFRIAKSNALMETRVIYVAPTQLPQQVINYYKKVFQFGSSQSYEDKLTIIWPQNVQKLPQHLSLSQKVFYSHKTMKRIKRIIHHNYAYIIPSDVSIDYVSLCCDLRVPLYCGNPQQLRYIQTKTGTKCLGSILKQQNQEGFGILPYAIDIYNKNSLVSELANLVCEYPRVKRWVLKIDNQFNSRGNAFVDVSKILSKQTISDLLNEDDQFDKKLLKESVLKQIQQSLIVKNQERIIPTNKCLYQNQQEFLIGYLSNGGIIEASINNMESNLQSTCFTIQIQPDMEWNFVCSYRKLTNQGQTVGCYFGDQLLPPLQIERIVNELKKKNLFGHFTLQFLKIPQENKKNVDSTFSKAQKELIYFNGIQCHLNQFSSAFYLKQFLSKENNALYLPKIDHPALKQLRMQTFFHLCRLQNISFDIHRKIGNVFMFLSGLDSGCMGVIAFNNNNKQNTFQQVSQVLEFLGNKISPNIVKNIPQCYKNISNTINGFLKKGKRVNKNSNKSSFRQAYSCNSLLKA